MKKQYLFLLSSFLFEICSCSGNIDKKPVFKWDHNEANSFAVMSYSDSTVLLIDKKEVTNKDFKMFCRKYNLPYPASTADSLLSDPLKPAMGFILRDAQTYCSSRGMRLLKLTDWKKLMLMCPQNEEYWWKDSLKTNEYAVFNQREYGTMKVGSKKTTVLGLYDIFGNAGEMVEPDTISYNEKKQKIGFYAMGGSYLGVMKWLSVKHIPQVWEDNLVISHVGCRCAVEVLKKEWEKMSK